MVAHRIVTSPVGSLLLVASDKGLVRVAFEIEGFAAVLEAVASKLGGSPDAHADLLDATAFQLDEYFAGTRRHFELTLDRVLSSGFRLMVQQYLPRIEYGQTQSYAEVAAAVGSPQAVRAVGSACATNPLPIVVPCHRVLRSDGSPGGYLGGLDVKRALLDLERRSA